MRKSYLIWIFLLVVTFAGAASAGEVSIFGPTHYIKTQGATDVITDTFTATAGEATLIIKNGQYFGDKRIDNGISSASIFINGEEIFSPNDFNQNVYLLESPINAEVNNTITVELNGSADVFITVEITQYIPVLNPITLDITSPLDGAVINRPNITVKGTVLNIDGNETGVTVNGVVATVYNGEFVVNGLPLEEGQNVITANATDTDGNVASHAILVNSVVTIPYITLKANIESGIAPLTTYFSVSTSIPDSVVSYSIDYEGDSVVDYSGATFEDVSFTYATEGVYYPTVNVLVDQSNVYSDSIVIIVLNQASIDTLLQTKWNAMKTTLANQDVSEAVSYYVSSSQERYQYIFTNLLSTLPDIVLNMEDIEMISIENDLAEYRIKRTESIRRVTYYIYFVRDEDGLWKIQQF